MHDPWYVLLRLGCRESEYTPCEPASPGQTPELTGHSAPGRYGAGAEGRRGSVGGVAELEDGSWVARPAPAAQSPGTRAEASRGSS